MVTSATGKETMVTASQAMVKLAPASWETVYLTKASLKPVLPATANQSLARQLRTFPGPRSSSYRYRTGKPLLCRHRDPTQPRCRRRNG